MAWTQIEKDPENSNEMTYLLGPDRDLVSAFALTSSAGKNVHSEFWKKKLNDLNFTKKFINNTPFNLILLIAWHHQSLYSSNEIKFFGQHLNLYNFILHTNRLFRYSLRLLQLNDKLYKIDTNCVNSYMTLHWWIRFFWGRLLQLNPSTWWNCIRKSIQFREFELIVIDLLHRSAPC